MKTLQDQWKTYRDAIYPKDIPADQNRECHQAFMAGALVALETVAAISECPDTEAAEVEGAAQISRLLTEAREWARLRGTALNAPRN